MKKITACLMMLLVVVIGLGISPITAYESELTQSEAKSLIDAAVLSRQTLQEYYGNHMRYVQGHWVQGNYIESKEINISISSSDSTQLYVTLMEHLLPGGSYKEFISESSGLFAESVSDRYINKFYGNNDAEQFIVEDGVRYIAAHAVQATISFSYSSESSKVELINVSKASATAKVFCEKIIGYDKYPMWVECKFIRTEDGWRISESAFADMMCSFHEYEYTLIDSPSTSDPAADLVFILPTVSIAAIASAFCLMRRRRENVL